MCNICVFKVISQVSKVYLCAYVRALVCCMRATVGCVRVFGGSSVNKEGSSVSALWNVFLCVGYLYYPPL